MQTPVYRKPGQETDYTFDFADRLKSGDNIQAKGGHSKTIVIAYDSTGKDVTSSIVASHDVSSSNRDQYVVHLQKLVEGEDYRLLCTVEGDVNGDIWPDEVEIRARARIG